MDRFSISFDPCSFGFHEHANINLHKPIEPQLKRKRLHVRARADQGSIFNLRKIVEQNSSLRIEFGWSFESEYLLKKMMSECVEKVIPKYSIITNLMTSDLRCSWIGFLPLNALEKFVYDDLSEYSLILYNNELIDFQIAVVEFIANYESYKQHAILRDDKYRFQLFKNVRKDPDGLANAYLDYMNSIRDICALRSIPRDLIDDQMGCHFIYHPELYFELLEFSILKGEVYE